MSLSRNSLLRGQHGPVAFLFADAACLEELAFLQTADRTKCPEPSSTHYLTRATRSALVRWTPASNTQGHFGFTS